MYAKTLPSRFDSLCKKCGKRSDQYTKSEYSDRVCKFVDRVIIEKRYECTDCGHKWTIRILKRYDYHK